MSYLVAYFKLYNVVVVWSRVICIGVWCGGVGVIFIGIGSGNCLRLFIMWIIYITSFFVISLTQFSTRIFLNDSSKKYLRNMEILDSF